MLCGGCRIRRGRDTGGRDDHDAFDDDGGIFAERGRQSAHHALMGAWWWRVLRAAVVVAAGAVVWVVVLPSRHVVPDHMAALTVRQPNIGGLVAKPATAKALAPSKSTVAAVRRAAKAHPAHTGIYEVGWASPPKASPQENAGLLVQLLPTPALARQVLSGVRHQYSSSRSVGGSNYRLEAHFAVPGVPGAEGLTYAISAASPASSSPAPAGTADVVTFREGSVAVLELLQSTGKAPSTAGVVTLARAELAAVRRAGPAISLAVVRRPMVPAIGTGVGVVVVGAGVVFLPEHLVGRRRRKRARRQQHERERALDQVRAGGRRTVRRHQAPAWRRQAHGPRRGPFWR